jgi:membrane protease YdiL (CAAX protease family)
MAMMLTRRPLEGLSLRLPRAGYVVIALLLLPMAELIYQGLQLFPKVAELLRERQMLVENAFELQGARPSLAQVLSVAALALVSAVSKELAFRGLILNGLRRRFRPWAAVLISSFFFAVYHMNVFVLFPAFVFGVVLGVLALRSHSIVPGVLLHLGCYAIVIAGSVTGLAPDGGVLLAVRLVVAPACAVLAVVLLVRFDRRHTGRALLSLLQLSDGPPLVTSAKPQAAEQKFPKPATPHAAEEPPGVAP